MLWLQCIEMEDEAYAFKDNFLVSRPCNFIPLACFMVVLLLIRLGVVGLRAKK